MYAALAQISSDGCYGGGRGRLVTDAHALYDFGTAGMLTTVSLAVLIQCALFACLICRAELQLKDNHVAH